MPNPMLFTQGISNARKGSTLAKMGQPDPTLFHTWFDDFDNFVANEWVITRVGVTPTEAVVAGDGGRLRLTMAATDLSSTALQWSGADATGVSETWQFVSGKQLFFKTRHRVSDVVQSSFVLGLQITDTTPQVVSDGVYFRKDDGDSNVNLVVMKAGVSTTTVLSGLLANNTDVTLGYHYDGKSELKIYVNDVQRGTSVVTNLPTVTLAHSIFMQNGEAVSKTMELDYMFVSKER